MDLEAEPLTKQQKMEDEKIIKILVLGESETGKTSFCHHQCNLENLPDQNEKIKRTHGCEIHLQKHIPQTENLVQDKKIQELITPQSQYIKNRFYIQFYDLSGDRRQRQFLPLYTKQHLQEYGAILFFFDLTNLKTLYNFYSWVQLIFQNKSNQMSYGCLWDIPFLIIGTKRDKISDSHFPQVKQNVKKYLKSIFICNTQDNLLFLSKLHDTKNAGRQNQIEFQIFNLFLSELCIENDLQREQRKRQQMRGHVYLNTSEYHTNSNIDSLLLNSKKYRLNPDFYQNKYMIYDKNTLWQDFKFSFGQKLQAVKEHINIMKYIKKLKCKKRQKQDKFQLSSTI